MAVLDDAEHEAAELDSAGFSHWVFDGLDDDLRFAGWLETQSAATPEHRGKRADLVAHFASVNAAQPPWAGLIEMQAQPVPDMILRVVEHTARLGQQLRQLGAHGHDRYQMMAGIVNLTASRQARELVLIPPQKGANTTDQPRGLTLRIWVRDVQDEDARKTLADIASGRTARCILAWVPWMAGADDLAVIAEWKRLASQEPEAWKRATYGALALVFAEEVGRLAIWRKELEGWNVKESTMVNEWKAEARAEATRDTTLKLLRGLIRNLLAENDATPIPAELNEAIDRETNPDVLDRWVRKAAKASSASGFWDSVKDSTTTGP